MTTQTLARRCLVSVLTIGFAAAATVVAWQGAPNLRANWKDLDRWSKDIGTGETEVGLGLHLSGHDGRMLVAFTDRRKSGSAPAPDIGVQVAVGSNASPSFLRGPTLSFVLDETTDRIVRLDLSSRLTVNDPAPGASINGGVSTMTRADLARMAKAETIRANILGTTVMFLEQQRRALQAFAADVLKAK